MTKHITNIRNKGEREKERGERAGGVGEAGAGGGRGRRRSEEGGRKSKGTHRITVLRSGSADRKGS